LTVVGGNTYKQCNFENIPACRRNYKENSSGYTHRPRLSGVSLLCSFVYSRVSLVVLCEFK